jgi:hypothetical protein
MSFCVAKDYAQFNFKLLASDVGDYLNVEDQVVIQRCDLNMDGFKWHDGQDLLIPFVGCHMKKMGFLNSDVTEKA